MSFFAGLVIGALNSLIVAHIYHNRQRTYSDESLAISTVDKDLDTVWGYVSKPENFNKFLSFGAEPFSGGDVKKGRIIEVWKEYNWKSRYFVVEWSTGHVFSWGENPNVWNYKIILNRASNKTEICLCTRSLIKSPWWKSTMLLFRERETNLDDVTVQWMDLLVGKLNKL